MSCERVVQPFSLRLPRELKDWLSARARGHERSINSEVIHILRKERGYTAAGSTAAQGLAIDASPQVNVKVLSDETAVADQEVV